MLKLKSGFMKGFVMVFILIFMSQMLQINAIAAPEQKIINYTVKKSDTLNMLAARFNTTVGSIKSANPGVGPTNLVVGSKIKIPYGSGIVIHHVKKGETLWRIAKKYGMDVEVIAKKNDIKDPNIILAGDVLAIPDPGEYQKVLVSAENIAVLLKNKDYKGLAKVVHPVKGIRFSPYSYVDLKEDLIFTPKQVANFAVDKKKYEWGAYDGSGDPITLTPNEYFKTFVYDIDYLKINKVSVDKVQGQGSTLENQFKVYPKAHIIEYYFPGTSHYDYMDWKSLRLALEKYNNKWYLVGIIHNQWTI